MPSLVKELGFLGELDDTRAMAEKVPNESGTFCRVRKKDVSKEFMSQDERITNGQRWNNFSNKLLIIFYAIQRIKLMSMIDIDINE